MARRVLSIAPSLIKDGSQVNCSMCNPIDKARERGSLSGAIVDTSASPNPRSHTGQQRAGEVRESELGLPFFDLADSLPSLAASANSLVCFSDFAFPSLSPLNTNHDLFPFSHVALFYADRAAIIPTVNNLPTRPCDVVGRVEAN